MTIAEDIRAAAKLLNKDTWHKGSYFNIEDGHLRMCAHGAVQAVINQAVKDALGTFGVEVPFHADIEEARKAALGGGGGAAAAVLEAAQVRAESGIDSDSVVWSKRPRWANPTHYIMGMVGLTVLMNDAPETTLEDVLAKFEEAALLAERLNV